VIANGTCVNSLASTIAVTRAPLVPGAITGDATICNQITNGTAITYSIAAVAGAVSYNWVVPPGGTILSGAGTTSVSVLFDSTTVSGTQLKVAVVNACVTGQYRLLALTTCETSRINQTEQQDQVVEDNLNLYPNPAGEFINLNISSESEKEIILEVYDVAGNKVREAQYTLSAGDNIIETNVTGLSSGTYFMRVIDLANNTVQSKLFVKE
jgi:hypothetical protein